MFFSHQTSNSLEQSLTLNICFDLTLQRTNQESHSTVRAAQILPSLTASAARSPPVVDCRDPLRKNNKLLFVSNILSISTTADDSPARKASQPSRSQAINLDFREMKAPRGKSTWNSIRLRHYMYRLFRHKHGTVVVRLRIQGQRKELGTT